MFYYYLQMMALSERFPCRQESCRRVSVTAPRAVPARRRSVSWACVQRMHDSAHPPPASTQVRSSWYFSLNVGSSWELTNAKSTSRRLHVIVRLWFLYGGSSTMNQTDTNSPTWQELYRESYNGWTPIVTYLKLFVSVSVNEP